MQHIRTAANIYTCSLEILFYYAKIQLLGKNVISISSRKCLIMPDFYDKLPFVGTFYFIFVFFFTPAMHICVCVCACVC